MDKASVYRDYFRNQYNQSDSFDVMGYRSSALANTARSIGDVFPAHSDAAIDKARTRYRFEDSLRTMLSALAD